ncbi:MAG: Ig-like domain-containing protein [Polyangia bacterium]
MRRLAVVMTLAGCGAIPARTTQALGAAHTLWLALGGESVTSGATDDATALVSSLGSAQVPAFDPAVIAPDAPATAVLVDRVRGYFLTYDLDVTTTRPTSGDYAAVLIGGTSSLLDPPQPSGIAGVGRVDCADTNPRSLGYAFSGSAIPAQGGVVALGATIAHEAAHGWGLEHTTDAHDPLYSVAQPQQTLDDLFALRFESGTYSSFQAGGGATPEQCGHADPIDHAALLLDVLGARTTTPSAAPTVGLAFPPDRPVLPRTLPLRIDASDDVGVTRVEVYRDLALVAVLGAPYSLTLTLPVADSTTLTIEAVDADGQRARVSRTFRVDDTVAPACDDSLPCTPPASCVDGFCAVASSDLSTTPSDLATVAPSHGGCAVGGRAPIPSAFVLLVVVYVLRSRRSSRAQG